MKRITSSLLALLLALSMLIGMVPAAYAAPADTIESIDSTETVDSTETEDVSDESEDVAAYAADTELTDYVVVKGINGFEGKKYASFADAYAEIKPEIEKLASSDALGQGSATSAEAFKKFFTDVDKNGNATLTYEITGNVVYDEANCKYLLTMGRHSSHYNAGEEQLHLINFKFMSATPNRGATLTVNSDITLPYEWWGEKVVTSISFENLTITGSAPSGLYPHQAFFEGIDFAVNNCTLNGIKIYNCSNVGGKYTITNSTLNGTGAPVDAYAIHLQGNESAPLTIKIDNNRISGYARGINIDQNTAVAEITNNEISIEDNGRSCIQLSRLAKTTVSGNELALTGGNAITLHECLLETGAVPEITVTGNTITGNGHLIYDDAAATQKDFTSENLTFTFDSTNTVASTVDKKTGVKDGNTYNLSLSVESTVNGTSTTGVAKVGTTTYNTLEEAINTLNSTNYTLTLLDKSAWDAATPVYWEAGTQSGYVAKLTDALTAAYMANAGDIKIVCRPDTDVGTMTHGHVADDITIYGNNAYISGGECDLEVDTFMFSRSTGAQDTTNGVYLDKDIVINAYELDNLGVWGERHTEYTVNVNLTDCDGKALEKNVQRVYISGTTGKNEITLKNCDFITAATAVYSNADGQISIDTCSFTGSKVPVNFNHKANGEQRLTVSNSTFKNCGDNGEWNQFAAPVRFVNSGSGTQSATVDTCTFAGTVGSNGDILIGDGRTGKESNDVTLTVTNTKATVQAQKPGYYNGAATDKNNGAEMKVESGETLNTSVEKMLPTALTAYVTVNGGTEQYATLDEAIAAAGPENGVITYTVTGVVSTDAAGWIQVAKAGLTNLTEVKFVGVGTGAGITINGDLAILADRNYDIDVSFENLTLRKPNPKYGGDYGHSTNYFTCWLRNKNAAGNTVTYTNCTFPNGACNNQYGKTVYANCKFTNATSGKYNLWNYGGNTEIKNSTFTGTRGIKTYNEGTLAVAPTVKIENTTFNGLTEKTAVVASKATDITFDNVTTMDCEKGTFEKDIENSGETTTITANGSGISGSFTITAEKGEEAAKDEFNISAGTFNSEVSSDYCADGFEVKANGNGTYGVVQSTQTTKGTRENPYTLDDLSTMTRAEYIAAQTRLGGTMYVTVGDYSYETNGTLGNGTADNSDRDSTKMNYYGAPGAKEGQYSDAAVGKNIVFVGGNITSGVTGYKDVDNPGTSLLLAVPAYTNVTFEGTTFKNVMSFNYQLYTSPWSQLGELKFDGCTFNGIIVGAIAAQTLTFNNCNFGNYTNTYAENGKNVGANNSNPIWVRPAYGNWTKGDNEGQGSDFKSLTTINFTGNTVVSTRPVKFERIAQWEMDTTVTATGNKFDIKDTGEKKNVGLYFGANAKFDLVVEGNTKNGSTAALYTAVYSAPNGGQYAGLPAGSTVKDSNGQDAVLEDAYEWKSTKKLTLKTTEEVAELSTTDSKNNHVTVRFATLAAAVKAAKPSDTITLLDNIKLTAAQTISKKLTIDLNGKTLDSTVYQTIKLNAGADLTVQDSGGTGKIANSYAPGRAYPSTIYLNEPKTAFTLVSGTIESDPNETSLQSVAINSKKVACTVNIQGGSVVVPAGATEGRSIVAGKDMTLNISGGTITGGLHGIDAYSGSTVNITGGKVTATYVDTGVIKEAYGMRIIGTANVTINGGEIQGIKMDDDGYKLNVPNVTLVSGKVNGSFYSISIGTIVFTVDPTATITFEKDTVKNFLPSTVELVQNENGTYGVTKKVTYVAEVNGTKYETLQAAIDAAPRKGTVKLLANTRENVTIDKMMTLDLNGHTLNGGTEKGKPALTITARTVTIKDSSAAQTGTIMREDTAENSGVSSHYVIDIQGNAWVMFESGNVKNNSGNTAGKGASLVRVGDDSVAEYPGLNIKGGTFTQDNFIVIKVDRGDLFLNGGTLNSANSYAIEDWHRATIKGGTVNGAVAAWTYSGGLNSDLTISGGTINGDVTSVNYGNAEGRTAKVSITGGRVTGELDTRSYNPATSELTSIDDATKATIKVTGGTFEKDPTKYVVEDSMVKKNDDGTFGVEKAYLAKIGDTSYYTMEEAFEAQTASGEPIVLLRDYTRGSPFNSGSINRTVDLDGHTWTCTGTDVNSAAFEINHSNVTLTVKNGKIVSSQLVGLIPSAMGGTIKYDNSGLVFEGVEMSTTATSGIETNGNNTNDSVTLKNSTLNVPNGFGIYFPSSGKLTIENSTINAKTMGVQVCAGSLNITGADTAITVTGDAVPKTENDGAIQDGAAISIVNRTGYKGLGTITVTGGTFTAKDDNAAIKAYDWANNTETDFTEPTKVEVSGGTFSAEVPADLCAPGYVPQDNGDGTYGVAKAPAVAKIGETEFTSLKDAIAKAEEGATIDIVNDINTPNVSYEITKNLTIKLNGHTITADGYDAVFQIGKIADVVLEGPGSVVAVENTGSAGKYAMAVWACSAGCTVTINGKINFSQNITHTDDPQMDMIYASQGTIIINDGRYESGTPAWTLNCKDAAYKDGTAKIIVNGGTFVGYDPRNNTAEGKGTSFVAAGVGVDNNTDGTFTAKPNMVAQIVDADGNSVAAYATLKEAVNAAKSGETVIVLKEATVEERITAEANITIDLNQKTVTVADGAGTMLKTTGDVTIKNGTLTSAVTANIINAYGKLKLESVKIYGSTVDGSNLVNVLGNAEVTIDAASEIVADGVGVAVFVGEESAAKDAKYTLNIYGKVTQKGKSYAISGNGSYPGTSYINIYEGAEVKANNIAEKKDCCAIYQPQASEINVCGGLVEGYCAIVMKSGTLNISGGTVRGIRNDNVLGDNNSAGNGASYDGSAIVVDSRKTGYAGNVKINVTGGTVESYYSTAIREIGNDSSMTQLVELTVTGGEIRGASKNLTNAENDILVRDISVSNVAISGGTFNHEVQADYCAVGYEPSEKDASGMYTVQKVSGNAYYTDDDGNLHYGYLTTLLNNEATVGRVITLIDSVDYKGSLVVEGNRTINLAGYTFESEFYVFVTNGCGIKDSTDGSALIKVAPEKLVFMSNNEQLPIYDSANKGYRLFNCKVKGKCETNGDSATIWVLPEFENKAAYKLLKSGNAHNATISVTISWTGNDGPAAQEFTFKQSLIDIYAAGEGGATFTLRLTGLGTALSGEMSNIKAQSSIKSGAGVSFTGKEYSLSN